jgi:hypothetical protein
MDRDDHGGAKGVEGSVKGTPRIAQPSMAAITALFEPSAFRLLKNAIITNLVGQSLNDNTPYYLKFN